MTERRAHGTRLGRGLGPAAMTALALVAVLVGCTDIGENVVVHGLPQRSGASADASSDAGPDARSDLEAILGVSCANGVRDGDETDVDCGGAICPPCANGRACVVARDCVMGGCNDATCHANSDGAGCSDGTREGFASTATFPDLAACAGGWSIAGLGVTAPTCDRASGNDGANPTGQGCSVADLCQVGWHVCESAAAVGARSGDAGCAGVAAEGAFFAARQSGGGDGACGAGENDLFGCGDVGARPDAVTCAPLDRCSGDLCAALPATWACGADGASELRNVTKTASEGGGVLCCRD